MVQRISALAPKQPGILGRTWAMLISLFVRAEPIELIDQRFNFLPHCFRWRGDLRRVRMVAHVWEQPQSGLQPPRRYYEVVCGQGKRYVLFQDLRIGTWHVRNPGLKLLGLSLSPNAMGTETTQVLTRHTY